MNTPERQPEPAKNYESQRHHLDLTPFQLAATTMTNLSEFAAGINARQKPTSSTTDFMFYDEKIEHAFLPPSIKEAVGRYGTLDGIDVILNHYEGDQRTDLTMRFHAVDQEDDFTELILTRPSYYNNQPFQPDTLTVVSNFDATTKKHVEMIPPGDVNRCIASLLDDKAEVSPFFASIDYSDGNAYESVAELLKAHANFFGEEATYDFYNVDGAKEGTLRCVVRSRRLIEAELKRITYDEVIIDEDGNVYQEQEAILTQIDLSAGALISFARLAKNQQVEQPIINPLNPDERHYNDVLQFIERYDLS